MKNKKIVNNKGFMLVETLIVSVFIVGIFSIIYTNFFPLVGEYERYKNYDTVESTYIAHWARIFVLNGIPDYIYNDVDSVGYFDITDCNLYTASSDVSYICNNFKNVNDVSRIYLTTYSLDSFKAFVKDNNFFQRDFQEYVAYLPTYKYNQSKRDDYRVIVEYLKNDVHTYGNMEVVR